MLIINKYFNESTRGASKDLQEVKQAILKITDISKYLLDEQNPDAKKPDDIKFKFKASNKNQWHLLQPIINKISPKELNDILIKNGYTINGDVGDLKSGFTISKDGLTIGCRWTSTSDKNSKSKTTENTEISERAVLIAIMLGCKKDTIKNRELIEQSIKTMYNLDDEKMDVYINSAILSSVCFYNNIKIDPSQYDGERQLENRTALIYKVAKMLGAPSNKDNWNPADIWLIKQNFNLVEFLDSCHTLNMLNNGIENEMINSKNIIPISLKQVKSKAVLDIIDNNYVSTVSGIENAIINNIHLGYTKNTKSFGSIEVHLENDYTIHAHARSSATSDIIYYQLVPPAGGTNSGIDKKLVLKYVYNDVNILNKQRELYDNTDSRNIEIVKTIIDNIMSYTNSKHISINTNNKELLNMYINAAPGVEVQRFVMTLLNLEAILMTCDNIIDGDITVTQKLFLSGLKADASSGQCPHYKIH
jgi:hypothetical protein